MRQGQKWPCLFSLVMFPSKTAECHVQYTTVRIDDCRKAIGRAFTGKRAVKASNGVCRVMAIGKGQLRSSPFRRIGGIRYQVRGWFLKSSGSKRFGLCLHNYRQIGLHTRWRWRSGRNVNYPSVVFILQSDVEIKSQRAPQFHRGNTSRGFFRFFFARVSLDNVRPGLTIKRQKKQISWRQ